MSFKKFKTEKVLLVSIGVLGLFLFVSAFSKELRTNVSMAEEESGASSPSSNETSSNEDSQDNEDSQEENSQNDEQSEPSTSSVPSVRTTKTTGNVEEVSEKSSNETSQQSIETDKETSENSEESEPSEKSQEVSEESIKYIEGYGDIVSKEGNVMVVKKDEKLFFLIPVKVESQVTLDEQGSVVDAKKSFLNWLLSALSF